MSDRPPARTLNGRELEALELIIISGLGQANGYRVPGRFEEAWPATPRLKIERSMLAPVLEAGCLELRDPDSTPIAILAVSDHLVDDEAVWIEGRVEPLRAVEHGPARPFRFTAADELRGRRAVLIDEGTPASGILRLTKEDTPLLLLAVGSDDAIGSMRLVDELVACAAELRDAVVRFLAPADVGSVGIEDVPGIVLASRGIEDVLDLRAGGFVSAGGAVILLTGLSGAGKSTIARALADDLNAHRGVRAVLLDGDHVRAELASELGFSAADRDRNLQRQAWVGARVAEAGGIAVCAPIAPFAASRAAMRAKVEPASPFILIHVATPLSVAEQRDRKGLYAKARAGEIKDFTGIDSPYEIPHDADLRLDTSRLSVEDCVTRIRGLLEDKDLIRSA